MIVISLDNERSNDDINTFSTSQSSIFQKVQLQYRDYSKLALLPLFWILTISAELGDLTLCNVNLTWAAVLY